MALGQVEGPPGEVEADVAGTVPLGQLGTLGDQPDGVAVAPRPGTQVPASDDQLSPLLTQGPERIALRERPATPGERKTKSRTGRHVLNAAAAWSQAPASSPPRAERACVSTVWLRRPPHKGGTTSAGQGNGPGQHILHAVGARLIPPRAPSGT